MDLKDIFKNLNSTNISKQNVLSKEIHSESDNNGESYESLTIPQSGETGEIEDNESPSFWQSGDTDTNCVNNSTTQFEKIEENENNESTSFWQSGETEENYEINLSTLFKEIEDNEDNESPSFWQSRETEENYEINLSTLFKEIEDNEDNESPSFWQSGETEENYEINLSTLFEYSEKKQKIRICKEFITIENNYINNLNILYQKIIIELLNQNIITNIQHNQIFSNIETFEHLHEIFYQDLSQSIVYKEHIMIGNILQNIGNFKEPYSEYTKNFDLSRKTIEEISKENENFNQFIKSRGLESFLIMPIQQIPRYKLLVEKLIKHTESDHPDYIPLTQALNIIDQTANTINCRKAYSDICKSLKIPEDLVSSNGVLIKEGIVDCISYKSLLERKVQHKAYLFNDMIVFVLDNNSNKLNSFKKKLFSNSSTPLTKDLKYNHLIKLKKKTIVKQHPTEKKVFNIDFYLFSCLSEDEKNIWMNNIQSAINNLNP